MRRVAHIVIIVMLLFAVPVKGALAASMVLCGPDRDGAPAMVVGPTAHDHHRSDQRHHDHDRHHAATMAGVGQVDDGVSHDQQSHGKSGAVKCNICAACCVGGALLGSAAVVVPPSVGADAPFPAPDVHVPWTLLAGLERPPRTPLV